MRKLAVAAATLATLLAASGCSPDPATGASAAPEPTVSPETAAPTSDVSYPAAITRELDIDFGSAPYDRVPACYHDGPMTVQDGRATFTPSQPAGGITDPDAEVELAITGSASYLEVGPDGRSYASVPFSCRAADGGGSARAVDSGALIVGGTQDDLQIVGLVTAGEPVDADGGSGSGSAGEGAASTATDVQLFEPAGVGETYLHSSLRNMDGYRYFVRPEEEGDTTEPSGRAWKTVAWDEEAGAVRQTGSSEDFMETVPQPDTTLVVGVDGDSAVLTGQEDLDDEEAFHVIADFMGTPDEESSEFAEDGAHRGYRSETKSWGSFTVTYYSPADGEPEWVGTCLAWSRELSDFPAEVTVDSPVMLGQSLEDYLFIDSVEAGHVDGEAPSLITDGDDTYTVDVLGGARTTGMLTSIASGTGCSRG